MPSIHEQILAQVVGAIDDVGEFANVERYNHHGQKVGDTPTAWVSADEDKELEGSQYSCTMRLRVDLFVSHDLGSPLATSEFIDRQVVAVEKALSGASPIYTGPQWGGLAIGTELGGRFWYQPFAGMPFYGCSIAATITYHHDYRDPEAQ